MTHAKMLRAAKALIVDQRNWIQGEYAETAEGLTIDADHQQACRFCAVGALAHISGLSPRQVEHGADVGAFLNQAAGEDFPHRINDVWGHAEVMAMYDRAINLAEAAFALTADAGKSSPPEAHEKRKA